MIRYIHIKEIIREKVNRKFRILDSRLCYAEVDSSAHVITRIINYTVAYNYVTQIIDSDMDRLQ